MNPEENHKKVEFNFNNKLFFKGRKKEPKGILNRKNDNSNVLNHIPSGDTINPLVENSSDINSEDIKSYSRNESGGNIRISKTKSELAELANLAIRATIDGTFLDFSQASKSKIVVDADTVKNEVTNLFKNHPKFYEVPVKKRNELLIQFCERINQLKDPSKLVAVLSKLEAAFSKQSLMKKKAKEIKLKNELIRIGIHPILRCIPEGRKKKDLFILRQSIVDNIKELNTRLKKGKHSDLKLGRIIKKLEYDTKKLTHLANKAAETARTALSAKLDSHFEQYLSASDTVSEAEVAHYKQVKRKVNC